VAKSSSPGGDAMRCDGCSSWHTLRKTVYKDGSEVVNWQAPDANTGKCVVLGLDTSADFGCAKFSPGTTHVIIDKKFGTPWQHWRMIECPECKGHPGDHGGGRCRCAGTGLVRRYDDGYVGEEHTRLHPEERKRVASGEVAALVCQGCKKSLDPHWVICPYCGFRPGMVAETEHVGEGNGGVTGRM
jgi:hypothetical protein